jgi:hypothetical protein
MLANYLIRMTHIYTLFQFGSVVLLDPTWDVDNLCRPSKTFRNVLTTICKTKPPVASSSEYFMAAVGILGSDDFVDYIREEPSITNSSLYNL